MLGIFRRRAATSLKASTLLTTTLLPGRTTALAAAMTAALALVAFVVLVPFPERFLTATLATLTMTTTALALLMTRGVLVMLSWLLLLGLGRRGLIFVLSGSVRRRIGRG